MVRLLDLHVCTILRVKKKIDDRARWYYTRAVLEVLNCRRYILVLLLNIAFSVFLYKQPVLKQLTCSTEVCSFVRISSSNCQTIKCLKHIYDMSKVFKPDLRYVWANYIWKKVQNWVIAKITRNAFENSVRADCDIFGRFGYQNVYSVAYRKAVYPSVS